MTAIGASSSVIVDAAVGPAQLRVEGD